jgi:hypothetical protein
MNTKARNATIFGIAAGLVLVPIVRALIRRYTATAPESNSDGAPPNRLFSAYRGKFRPHHRKPRSHNGVH